MDYESDMKRFSDHMNALAYAEEKGLAKGEARGEARVMKIAKNMLAKGYSVAEVIGITHLPREQVRALKRV
jgi:predicted transposase YdaD